MKKIIFAPAVFALIFAGVMNGEVTRKVTEKYPDGKTKSIVYYNIGKEVATEVVDEKGAMTVKGNIPDGKVLEYDEAGKVTVERTFKGNKRNGWAKYFSKDGLLSYEVNIKDNLSDGAGREYWEDGKTVKSEETFSKDKLNGPKKFFSKDGKLSFEINFVDNKKDGDINIYYRNGKIKSKQQYKNDMKEGSFKLYYLSGKVRRQGEYKNDLKDGIFKEYFEDGKPAFEDSYSSGSYLQGKAFDKDGKSADIYESTLKSVMAGDFDSDFERLRMAFTKTSNYDPYNSDENKDSMYKAFRNEKYEEALKLGKAILEKEYVDMDTQMVCSMCYMKTKNEELEEFHRQVFYGLLNSILDSGDGKTPETAYRVIKVREEYVLLSEQGYKVLKQSLVKAKTGNCDLMEVKNMETGEESKSYFNVKISMDYILNKFKDLKETKE
ncbi:MAG: hypothetical protein A2231_12600 [Candidatus Firestonebacteria bacterium RIFOXYA2_FULL_40_8]|nr:MAG: hypothetical protein A2231_12600 [Candidatus Firestonebacteria bacterium RIFOXYA2_FULL_40_8]